MTGIEKITAKILADAKERARVILEEAQNECVSAAEEYATRADNAREEIVSRAMAEAEAITARARAAAAMERRDVLLMARAALVEEAFEAAKRQICETDYGKYRELLVAFLRADRLCSGRAGLAGAG